MDALIELLKFLIPAVAVLYAMYLVVNGFLNRDLETRKLEIRGKQIDTVLPIRLQAYERMTLFLERISPQNLLLRINHGGLSAKDYHRLLLEEIRNEYNHNLSQQVYMSEQVWQYIKNSKEDLIMLINESSALVKEDQSGLDLAKKIFEVSIEKKIDPISHALQELKKEVAQLY
jgi:hypothetical protein